MLNPFSFTWPFRKEKGEKRNMEFYTLRRIIPRRRRGIKLRGARIEDEDAWIPIRAAREKSSRGSCPRGNISRTSKEEGPKRKRFARIRGRKEPKRKRNVCVYERERVFARENWKTYAKEKERERASSKDEASVRTRGEWSVRTRSSRAS